MSDIIANKGSISGSIVSSGEINSGTIGIGGKSLHGGSVNRNAGGTYEYPVLRDKPQINDVELIGNKTSDELHIKQVYTYEDVQAVGAENEMAMAEIDRMFNAVFGV